MSELNNSSNNGRRTLAQDSAMNSPRRLPDIPGRYAAPAPPGVVRPRPVLVPKANSR